MKKQFKKSTIVFLAVCALIVLSATAFAAGRWVQAFQDDTMTIKLNGVAQTFIDPNDGSKMVPLVYNDRTYLPVRAISNLLGVNVGWDGVNNTVLLSNNGAVPVDTTPTTPSSGTTSTDAGTISDPVEFGTYFSWRDECPTPGFSYNSNVTMRVLGARKVTTSEIQSMGFNVNSDPSIEYMLVTVDLKGRNVTPTDLEYNYLLYSNTVPRISGSESTSGKSITGGTDYGFDGSIEENLDISYGYGAKINKGSSASLIDYGGNILLPVVKGETNYLRMARANFTNLSDDSKYIYFKLN